MTRAVYCDECKHYDPKEVESKGIVCKKGHKPRFYLPKTTMQSMTGVYGYRRRCEDFKQEMSCPPCNNNCNQGRACPARSYASQG